MQAHSASPTFNIYMLDGSPSQGFQTFLQILHVNQAELHICDFHLAPKYYAIMCISGAYRLSRELYTYILPYMEVLLYCVLQQ